METLSANTPDSGRQQATCWTWCVERYTARGPGPKVMLLFLCRGSDFSVALAYPRLITPLSGLSRSDSPFITWSKCCDHSAVKTKGCHVGMVASHDFGSSTVWSTATNGHFQLLFDILQPPAHIVSDNEHLLLIYGLCTSLSSVSTLTGQVYQHERGNLSRNAKKARGNNTNMSQPVHSPW